MHTENIEEVSFSLDEGVRRGYFGSKTEAYRAASRGDLILRKRGRATVVDAASAKAYYQSLPIAKISIASDGRGRTTAV